MICFEYKVLPAIPGKPMLNAFCEIIKQLKANKLPVSGTICGGASGYLGMLVSAQSYDTVAPITPFIPSLMPGALVITPTNTKYQIAIMQTQYDRSMTDCQTYVLM